MQIGNLVQMDLLRVFLNFLCVIFTEIGFAGDSSLASCVARSGSTNDSVYRGLAKLTSPTNLRIHSASSSSFVHGSWTVVEYY